MDSTKRIALIIVLVCLLTLAGCGPKQTPHPTLTPTPSFPIGDFRCPIKFSIGNETNIVFLGLTLSADHQIDDWYIFDIGTRTASSGMAGKSSWTGNELEFNLDSYSGGLNITYAIHGKIEAVKRFSGEYQIDYGGQYGSVNGNFDCDLVPLPTPTTESDTPQASATLKPTETVQKQSTPFQNSAARKTPPLPVQTATTQNSGIPVITRVELTKNYANGDLIITQTFYFSDPDGDVNRVDYNILSTTRPDIQVEGGDIFIPGDEQRNGASFSGEWDCGSFGYSVTLTAVLTDRQGHQSAPYPYTMDCVSQ